MFAHCEHHICDVGITNVTSKNMVPCDDYNLAVHDEAGHRSQGNVNLEYEDDEIKDGDW